MNLGRGNVCPPALVYFDVSLKVGGKVKSLKKNLKFVIQVASPRISVYCPIRYLIFLPSNMGHPHVSLQPNVGHHTFLPLQKLAHSEGKSMTPAAYPTDGSSVGARMGSDHCLPRQIKGFLGTLR
jgi:hypothetical protein